MNRTGVPREDEIQSRLRRLEKALPRRRYARLDDSSDLAKYMLKRSLAAKIVKIGLILALALFLLPPFLWPADGPVSSGFLFRLKPDSVVPGLEVHHGIDIAAARGSKVSPTALGFVSEAGYASDLGRYVRVRHLFGFTSLYAHMDSLAVGKGAFVVPGLTTLGTVGNTGRSTGPHLHFAVYFVSIPCPPGLLLFFHSVRRKVVHL